jgi:hypothetical protein
MAQTKNTMSKKSAMGKKKMADGGKVTNPYTTKATATAPTYNRSGSTFTRNTDGTYTQKPQTPVVKAKRGGAMKGKKC